MLSIREAKLSGNILVLKRLNLPPNVFFSKAHTLRVCSVYATVQSGIKQPTGLWIPVEEVKEKVKQSSPPPPCSDDDFQCTREHDRNVSEYDLD